MEDKKIVCKDCGTEFTFSVAEQEFYKEKGFENDPVRCKSCRDAKKLEIIREVCKRWPLATFFFYKIFLN